MPKPKAESPAAVGAPDGAAGTAGAAMSVAAAWTVYILECADGSLYTGITNDLGRRLAAHEAGRGAKYTKGRGPFVVRYTESHATRSLASKREAAIKALDAAAKRRLAFPETG